MAAATMVPPARAQSAAVVTPTAAQPPTAHIATVPRDADALYDARDNLASGLAAAAEWERRLAANPDDFESAWKLARASYWLGSHVPQADRRRTFERGIDAGRRAVALQPSRAEGHFWVAANMGAMADGFGLRAGIRYRTPVKEALETALRLDPAYLQGGPDRALGRWYMKVPRLFGGSDAKSVEHLQRSLTYAPNSIASHFYLAETYLDMGRKDDARHALTTVLSAPFHPDWTPEEQEFKQQAKAHLSRLAQ